MRSAGILHRAGFTLIELLVALAVFSVISAVVYTGLYSVLTTGERTAAELERLAALQRGITIMQGDLGQLVDRPVRDGFGDTQPAVLLEEGRLWMTVGGTANPLNRRQSGLRRVGYELDEERGLIRYTYDALDQPIDPEPRESVLLTGVEDWRLRFRHDGGWVDQWPPLAAAGTAPGVPRGIAVRLTLEDYGVVERTFPN